MKQSTIDVTVRLPRRSPSLKRKVQGLEDLQSRETAEEIGVAVLDAVLYGTTLRLREAIRLATEAADKVIAVALEE